MKANQVTTKAVCSMSVISVISGVDSAIAACFERAYSIKNKVEPFSYPAGESCVSERPSPDGQPHVVMSIMALENRICMLTDLLQSISDNLVPYE